MKLAGSTWGASAITLRSSALATYRHWSVSLWRDPDDVPHCGILSLDKTKWRVISATLCRWRRCFVADQLWLMKRIREEEDFRSSFGLGDVTFFRRSNHTKFHQHSSLHGQDITTSDLEKQTSAILKFFFWFWPRLCHRYPHDILHKAAKLHAYRPPNAEIWRHINFSRWRPRLLNSGSGFLFVDVLVFKTSVSTSKLNFVDITQFTAEPPSWSEVL